MEVLNSLKFQKCKYFGGGVVRRVEGMLKLQIDRCITDFAAVQNDGQA